MLQTQRVVSNLLMWTSRKVDFNAQQVKESMYLPMTPQDYDRSFHGSVSRDGRGTNDKEWIAALSKARTQNPDSTIEPQDGVGPPGHCDTFCLGCG